MLCKDSKRNKQGMSSEHSAEPLTGVRQKVMASRVAECSCGELSGES